MNKIIILISLALFSSCNYGAKEHEHEQKEDGIEALAYTLYSDKTEIFVEFKPLIAGMNTKFAAHFTILGEYFKPLTKGKVTVTLFQNGKAIKQTSNEPSIPGIYRLSLQPTVAGKGDLIFDIETEEFTDRQVIRNVTVYPDENAALKEQSQQTGADGDITYLKEQAWKVEFANAPVTKQHFSNVIKTSGQILPAPGDELIITAKANGIVRFAGNKTIVGSRVNSGSPLFSITGGDLSANNLDVSVQQAKSIYEKAKADFERSAELVKDKIVSEKEFQQDKVAFENARSDYQMISKGYTANGQIITSPMEGFIRDINVKEGQSVAPGAQLATISKNSKYILQANVSQKYFADLPKISSANFKAVNSDEIISIEKYGGKLISFGKSASAGSPFIPVTFEINHVEGIIPGSITEVYLKFNEIENALVIPSSSLIEEQGNFFIYVQTAGESFEKREVKTGGTDGINVQILSGVTEGERVVTKGAYQIKLATASGTLPAHGHEH
jgi:membrane fusion protein, heavy metal efflux system